MYIIDIHYIKPMEEVDRVVDEHRAYLKKTYAEKNILVMSGPKNPRTGGLLIAQANNLTQIEELINNDPYNIHGVAEYTITEFTPMGHDLSNCKL